MALKVNPKKECKKFSKVEKRISKTNERLVGAIGKFQQWQVKDFGSYIYSQFFQKTIDFVKIVMSLIYDLFSWFC